MNTIKLNTKGHRLQGNKPDEDTPAPTPPDQLPPKPVKEPDRRPPEIDDPRREPPGKIA